MEPAAAKPKRKSPGANPSLRTPLLTIFARVALVVAGGHAASAGVVATLSVVLPLAGMARSEAVILSSMLGFILYVVLLLWAFAERRLWRFCFVLALAAGGGLAALSGVGG